MLRYNAERINESLRDRCEEGASSQSYNKLVIQASVD